MNDNKKMALIQELHKFLQTATQAAGCSLGAEPVISLMRFSGIYDPVEMRALPTVSEILNQVEQAGIELTPLVVMKINNSSPRKVQDAIAIYVKTYGKGNRQNLFLTILESENRRKPYQAA